MPHYKNWLMLKLLFLEFSKKEDVEHKPFFFVNTLVSTLCSFVVKINTLTTKGAKVCTKEARQLALSH
jgi:hypothetical protein